MILLPLLFCIGCHKQDSTQSFENYDFTTINYVVKNIIEQGTAECFSYCETNFDEENNVVEVKLVLNGLSNELIDGRINEESWSELAEGIIDLSGAVQDRFSEYGYSTDVMIYILNDENYDEILYIEKNGFEFYNCMN